MILQRTSLSENIVQFCRYLRHKGFVIGIEEEAVALQALEFIEYTDPGTFRTALKATLCRSKSHTEEFDLHFNEYWRKLGKALDAKMTYERSKTPSLQTTSFKSLKTWLHGNRNESTEEIATYSLYENLSQKDFATIPRDNVDELMQILKALAKRLAAKKNRRFKFTHKIEIPDLRQTLRRNLRRGGELLEIIHRKPKRNRMKTVLLCDVSKSMELYTVFFLQFMYAFQQVNREMETFSFGTALKRLTPFLRGKNFVEALRLLSAENSDWMGGTRIGESLNTFVTKYSKDCLDSRTIVIILSDGWDVGDQGILERSMRLLHKKAKKIIWLNPLAGYESYRTEVAGMQTAIPYIDVFASAHNVDSLRRLGKWL